MQPSKNQENPHEVILDTLLTILRSLRMSDRPEYRAAGAAIEADLIRLTRHGGATASPHVCLQESEEPNP